MWKCPECSAMISHGGTCCGSPEQPKPEPVGYVDLFTKNFRETLPNNPLFANKYTAVYTTLPEPDKRLREALEKVRVALDGFGDGSLARIARHFGEGSEEWAIIHNADESIALALAAVAIAREALGTQEET